MSRGEAPAALPARDHCLAPGREVDPVAGYGRMFGRLSPLTAGEAFVAEQGTAAVRGTSARPTSPTSSSATPPAGCSSATGTASPTCRETPRASH